MNNIKNQLSDTPRNARKVFAVAIIAVLVSTGLLVRAGANTGDFTAQSLGDLDVSFGNGGKVATEFFGSQGYADVLALALQPDGKLVVAGDASDGGKDHFALARYSVDGSLDPSFGTGEKVTTDFSGVYEYPQAVVIQTDGKIVAGGALSRDTSDASTQDFALARYNSDGTLDASFGSGGKVTTDIFGNRDDLFAIALQPDGKLVAAGRARHTNSNDSFDWVLARYLSNGSLDPSFGSGGKVTADFFGRLDGASGVCIQPDGRIVVAGGAQKSSSSSITKKTARGSRWICRSFPRTRTSLSRRKMLHPSS